LQRHGLPRKTANTICDPVAFKAELKKIRSRGYAINRHESNEQVDGIAAPIFDFMGKCIASISVAVIVPLQTKDILEYAAQVMEAASVISNRMGYSPALGAETWL
jgi:DNA-binding IclR family transcriptional regulator